MPSSYSTERSELCRHDTSRIGCISCKQHGVRGRLTESEFKLAQIRDRLRALPNSILRASTEEMRQYLVEEAEEAKAKQDLSEIRKVVDSVADEVRTICAKTEPHMLAKAFEEDAAAREREMQNNLEAALGKEPPQLKTADPELKKDDATLDSSFKGLDLTNIPATPDYLLDDPLGLAVFLRAGKGRNPMSAVGSNSGPAVMSYGRALAMFGPPESHTESMPRTEREYRERDTLNPPTVAIVSEEEQWALFTEDKCLPYTEMLVSEYVKRVKAKANVDKAKTSDSSHKEESSTRGWPDVEGHDWAGLTNWIHRCMKMDKKFFEVTLPSWKKQREDQRAKMIDRLSKWNLSDAVASGFDDGSLRYDDPRKHWPFSKSLAEIEAEEASEHH